MGYTFGPACCRAPSALISVLVQLIAAVVFPIALLIFTILYCCTAPYSTPAAR